jgi:hypothetical protein
VEWLAALPFSLRIPELRVLVVHAGAVPGVALAEQDLNNLYTMRDVAEEGAGEGGGRLVGYSGRAPEGAVPWAGTWGARGFCGEEGGFEHVVFGHDAMRKLQRCALSSCGSVGRISLGQRSRWASGQQRRVSA